ncbi:alpha/beta fold hydrolase [Radiobacillus sp. PE A8.2]|uniref:alpha/beta fold hydrolase n=1 Tax=Radiobacillus sp. PE A8.2 TaxID=3380349 RepID=UPI00388DBB00
MERYINTENSRLWTSKKGHGIPVILISGGPGICNYMHPVSELIDDISKVIMFDPRGCGRSSNDENGYGINTTLQDLEKIREAYDIEKWIVIGHSWGADVALAYALSYPESVLKFVSIAGTGIQNDRDWKQAYVRGKTEKMEVVPDISFPVNKIVHRSLIDSWRQYIKSPSLLSDISQLSLPCLFVVAENDIRPSWPIEQITALINHSSFKKVKESGHYIRLDKPHVLKEMLRDFIGDEFKLS